MKLQRWARLFFPVTVLCLLVFCLLKLTFGPQSAILAADPAKKPSRGAKKMSAKLPKAGPHHSRRRGRADARGDG